MKLKKSIMNKIIYFWIIIGLIVFHITSCEFVGPDGEQISINIAGEIVESVYFS